VSWRRESAAAEVETSQMWVFAPSAVESVTVNSTCVPSGESCGAPRAFRWRKSSVLGKRGESAAWRATPMVRKRANDNCRRKGRLRGMAISIHGGKSGGGSEGVEQACNFL